MTVRGSTAGKETNMKENAQVVKDAYDRFLKGDVPGILNLVSDDIEWTTPEIEGASFGGERRGRKGVEEFFKLLSDSEETTKFEPREFIVQGDRVVALGKYAATVRSTDRSYETDWVHVFAVKDGKITGFQEFFDNAAATRAFQKAATA